jgi:predicted DCC family thiol-disulfide oxidoreductase YuxK
MEPDRTSSRDTGDPFVLFFDGGCPICRREVAWMKQRDRFGRLSFINIDAPGFDARAYGLDHIDFMQRIHGQLPDGTLLSGVQVFREAYSRLGFAPLVALSRIKPIAWLLERAYVVFARNRTRLTGRCTSESCSRAA